MDEFITKLNEYMTLAEEAVVDVAPEVWNLTLLIVRLQGVMWTLTGVLLLVVIGTYWKWVYPRLVRWDEACPVVVTLISSVASIIVFAAACDIWLLDLETWLCLISPEGAIVYRVGEQVGVF